MKTVLVVTNVSAHTPEDRLRIPEGPRRRVLTHPVNPRHIIDALAAMGVKPEAGGLVR